MENFFPEDLEGRIRKLEEALFPIFGMEVPDQPRLDFSVLPLVDQNAEFSIRFRFALMAVIIASLCGRDGEMPADLQFLTQELYGRIISSIANYKVRVQSVIPVDSPLTKIPFCQSAFRERSRNLDISDITNGRGMFNELISAFGEEANSYLSRRNGSAAGALFIESVTTGRAGGNPLLSLVISALIPALINRDEDFKKVLDAFSARMTALSEPSNDQVRDSKGQSVSRLSNVEPQMEDVMVEIDIVGGSNSRGRCLSDLDLKKFPQAMMAIEYRPVVEAAWSKLQELPEEFQRRFLEFLDAEPSGDPEALYRDLKAEHIESMRPYDDEAANDALHDIRTIGNAAEQEFKRAYALFSTSVPLAEIVRRIEVKFGPTARTRAEREAKDRAEREAVRRAQLEARDRADQEAVDRVQRDAAKRAKEDAEEKKFVFALGLIFFLFLLFGASIIG